MYTFGLVDKANNSFNKKGSLRFGMAEKENVQAGEIFLFQH